MSNLSDLMPGTNKMKKPETGKKLDNSRTVAECISVQWLRREQLPREECGYGATT